MAGFRRIIEPVLTSTFVHIPGVSWKTEISLWEQGAENWYAFLANPERFRTGSAGAKRIQQALNESLQHLEKGEHQYFRKRLPAREAWRVFPEFRDSLIYLDIETCGTPKNEVTVVGAWDGQHYFAFVQGENLADFPDFLSHYSVLVTFFGSGFDLPVLKRTFPHAPFDQIHIDLCPTLRRIGLRGGLKSIEKTVGIERSPATVGMTGYDAVLLWRKHRAGRSDALPLLLEYNREDVRNLEPLMEHAYSTLRRLVYEELADPERFQSR
ncbi:MAG: exonuclease [Armatimonadetes bacterium]|nr:MAG: exonuclease [Armatimonadota bacterium]